MSSEREIELDVDTVFPPLGSRSGFIRKPEARPPSNRPPSTPPLRTLPPPPATPGAAAALERIQEDVDLVIEATSRRLDETTQRIEAFERTVRGVLGAQERRVRELETQLYEAQRRVAELGRELDLQVQRGHELHARNAVALARVEVLERAEVLRGELAALASESLSMSHAHELDSRESTQKILRS